MENLYDNIPTKRCSQCEREKPLHPDFFHKDVGNADGFKSVCARCRSEQVSHEEKEAISENFERIRKQSLSHLEKVVSGGSDVPHVAELYQCAIDAFGGPRLLMQNLAVLYHDPKTSSQTKQRILQNIVYMGVKVSDSGMIARDLESVPTEELERLLDDRVNSAARRMLSDLSKVPPRIAVIDAAAETVSVEEVPHERAG